MSDALSTKTVLFEPELIALAKAWLAIHHQAVYQETATTLETSWAADGGYRWDLMQTARWLLRFYEAIKTDDADAINMLFRELKKEREERKAFDRRRADEFFADERCSDDE